MKLLISTYKYKNSAYDKTLKIEEVDNGSILPLHENKGGVVNEKGDFVSLSYHDGEWFKLGGKYNYDSSLAEKSTLEVIYLGVFIHQWGHFILDSLSRAWIISHLKDTKRYKYVFLSENDSEIKGNYLEALTLLGLQASQIIVLSKPTKFKKIIVPQMSTNKDHGFNKEYPMIFKTMIKNANIKNISVPARVYLTRTNLKVAHKKEYGEKIIENNFRKNNYTVISPEKLNVKEQIAIFQNAKEIVCLNGSIPFDIVFASKKLKLIVINKTSLLHINLYELSAVSGIKPIYINGYYEPFKTFPRTLGEGPFLLMFGSELEDFFKNRNMKYTIPSNYPSKLVLGKYTLNCLKIVTKDIIKKILRRA